MQDKSYETEKNCSNSIKSSEMENKSYWMERKIVSFVKKFGGIKSKKLLK